MNIAYEKENQRLTAKVEEQRLRHNKTVKNDDILHIGACVFLRNRVLGRNKIQEVWNSVPYVVIRRCDPESNAYVEQPVDGFGRKKTINRVDLKLYVKSHDSHSDDVYSSSDDSSPVIRSSFSEV